jgi:ABC-type Fe3+/spermidine/putrescine transport system ATPase subunit
MADASPSPTARRWALTGVLVPGAGQPRLAIDALDIPRGITAVLGPSGAGKSTLLMVLAGALRVARGRVEGFPADPGRLPVFWSPDGGWWPGLDVRAHVRAVAPEGSDWASEVTITELAALAPATPAELSAGERDRLAVARGMASRADCVLFDEPFAHLDAVQGAQQWGLLVARARAYRMSVVYATHAPERVVGWADQVVCMDRGGVLAAGAVEELYARPASPVVAACLGPATWFDAAQAARWLGDGARAGCIRPERLAVVPAGEEAGAASGTVRASRFHGAYAETVLHNPEHAEHAELTVRHRPARAPEVGARVALRLLTLALLVAVIALLGGCGGGDPVITPKAVVSVMVPSDGPVQPTPRGVTALPGGGWLVLDTAGRLLEYGADRALQRQWRMPAYSVGRPENATVLPDGRIAVADTHYHRVVLFAPDGTVAGLFGRDGDGDGEFRFPVGICADGDGDICVSEYGGHDRVQVFDGHGKFVRAFGTFGDGPGQFQRPQGLCFRDGVLYVADAMNNRIQKFKIDGTPLGVVGGDHPPEMRFPYAIGADAAGVLTVVEYGGGRVTRLGADGSVLGRFGHPGRDEGEFATPWGMARQEDGRILVADTGNRRLVEVDP